MKYTVTELTTDGSFFDTNLRGLTKEEAEEVAKEMTDDDFHQSEYFAEEEH